MKGIKSFQDCTAQLLVFLPALKTLSLFYYIKQLRWHKVDMFQPRKKEMKSAFEPP